MIDLQLLRDNRTRQKIYENLKSRGVREEILEKLQNFLEERSKILVHLEDLQRQRNVGAKKLGELKKANQDHEFNILKQEMEKLNEQIGELKPLLQKIEQSIEELGLELPNIVLEDVPIGQDERDNVVLRVEGEKPKFSFTPKPHFEIVEEQKLVDFARGVKLAGSRFYVYNDKIAHLERRLVNLMLDIHRASLYQERAVPFLVRDECMFGTGQYPKFEHEYYRIKEDKLSLIPTAEVPLTNLYAQEILEEEDLPIYLTAATPCFRREAGAAGKDTRGLIRVHQFMKVELVKFCTPENSRKEHESLLADAEKILKHFDLHYRVVHLCRGDTGFSSASTYDLEVYLPGQDRWLEISSVSNFLDFQARRAKIRFKRKATGKNEYVHTLNASGVAAGRLIVALIEYHQKADGSVDWEKIERYLKQVP